MREHGVERTPYKEYIGQPAHEPKSNIVVNDIADDGAVDAIVHLRRKLVAMMPALERAFLLNVHEMVVWFKFCDQSNPVCAEGKKVNGPETRDHFPCPGLPEILSRWIAERVLFRRRELPCSAA